MGMVRYLLDSYSMIHLSQSSRMRIGPNEDLASDAEVALPDIDNEFKKMRMDSKVGIVVPIVDTNVIPDRNAGIATLLLDLQSHASPEPDGQPLLANEFGLIDVGVSRATVAGPLKALLSQDLQMNVLYVATERPEAVPYAYVFHHGEYAGKIRSGLSRMISTKSASREVEAWHYAVDSHGKISSIGYSYRLYGNEVWESYFMGQAFLYGGERIAYADPDLDLMLATEVRKIEAMMSGKKMRDSHSGHLLTELGEYRIEIDPLEKGLKALGIQLQRTAIPNRIDGKQNVLFLGNVLNHYPKSEQIHELERVTSTMEEGDLIILQMDGLHPSFIEVSRIKKEGGQRKRERVRWIDTSRLELYKPDHGSDRWQKIDIKPMVQHMVTRFMECLDRQVTLAACQQSNYRVLCHQIVSHVFSTFFRTPPSARIMRIAIREALRRLPTEDGPKGLQSINTDVYRVFEEAFGIQRNLDVSEVDGPFTSVDASRA